MHQYQAVPAKLIFKHGRTLKNIAKIAARMAYHNKVSGIDLSDIPPMMQIIDPPDNALVDAYVIWSGASPEKYPSTIPAHMISQWSLSPTAELLLQSNLPMDKVINQGVTLNIYGDIPRNQPLHLQTSFESHWEENGLIRVTVKIVTGTTQQTKLQECLLHMAFIMPNFKKSIQKNQSFLINEDNWQSIAIWHTTKYDGLKFALLTGDINYIHWIPFLAKFSPFKNTVLHGFGVLARSYECMNLSNSISHLNIRFLKPVLLPAHSVTLQTASIEKHHHIRLVGEQGQVHFLGEYQTRSVQKLECI